jgi:hypothetical protein
MTLAFAVAGITQVYLERRLGMDFLVCRRRSRCTSSGSSSPRAVHLGVTAFIYNFIKPRHARRARCSLRRRSTPATPRKSRAAPAPPAERWTQRPAEALLPPHRSRGGGLPRGLRRAAPVLLKGPTGCGKSRFVEAMAHRARAAARHRRVQRRDLRRRPPRALAGARRRHRLAGRPRHPRGARGRDPLPRRGRRGARGRDRRAAPAQRPPPRALRRPARRAASSRRPSSCWWPASTPATAAGQGAQALDAAALRGMDFDYPRPEVEAEIVAREVGVEAAVARKLVALRAQGPLA